MAYLETILTLGERVDGSSLFPFIQAGSSDLYVVPRFRTAFVDPFAPIPIACIDRQELDFILLVDFTVESEVPDFAVSVFDLSAGCCYCAHAFAAEVVEFGIGRALVVAALVGGGEETRVAG